jgi:hypothetical protein
MPNQENNGVDINACGHVELNNVEVSHFRGNNIDIGLPCQPQRTAADKDVGIDANSDSNLTITRPDIAGHQAGIISNSKGDTVISDAHIVGPAGQIASAWYIDAAWALFFAVVIGLILEPRRKHSLLRRIWNAMQRLRRKDVALVVGFIGLVASIGMGGAFLKPANTRGPSLNGRIEGVSLSWRGDDTNRALAHLFITISNLGDEASIARDFATEIATQSGRSYPGKILALPDMWDLPDSKRRIYAKDDLLRKASSPIAANDFLQGVLMVDYGDLDVSVLKAARYTLSFRDVRGREHLAEQGSLPVTNAQIPHFPKIDLGQIDEGSRE